jgi:molybdate transport system regulatory protein
MKVGARNRIVGKVVEVKKGTVMAQVKVKVPRGVLMQSVMTADSADDMALRKGDEVEVVVKAVNVLLLKR